jgi:hypothetical protein
MLEIKAMGQEDWLGQLARQKEKDTAELLRVLES